MPRSDPDLGKGAGERYVVIHTSLEAIIGYIKNTIKMVSYRLKGNTLALQNCLT